MHHKYHTEGLIIGGFPSREANKFLLVFTRDFGLVGASAQGTRNISSKYRYGLEECSLSDLSLVKGREHWKITNVIPRDNFYFGRQVSQDKREIFVKVNALLRRFLQGEEGDEVLFKIVLDGFRAIQKAPSLMLETLETILVLKIISSLGILKNLGAFEDLIGKDFEEIEVLPKTEIKKIVSVINESLFESQI